jgi:RimJ/RimL family protein N-acetyltransferase
MDFVHRRPAWPTHVAAMAGNGQGSVRCLECRSTRNGIFPAPLSRYESDAMADRLQELIEQRGWGFWALESLGEERFIGFAGLHVPTYEVPASPCVEIGWRLAAAHWGKGYATEAALASLQIGFERLGLLEIVSFTAVQNQRSRAVMERIGMRDGGERFAHPRISENHPLSAHALYRLTREQWVARSP